mgnify:CR=1 FL=1
MNYLALLVGVAVLLWCVWTWFHPLPPLPPEPELSAEDLAGTIVAIPLALCGLFWSLLVLAVGLALFLSPLLLLAWVLL